MKQQKIFAMTNLAVWVCALLVMAMMAGSTLKPLLYISDRGEWYSYAAAALPSIKPTAYAFSQKALEFDPQNEKAQYLSASYEANKLGSKDAQKKLEEIYRKNNSANSRSALASLAYVALTQCSQELAHGYISEGLKKFPQDAAFYHLGATLSLQEGDREEAKSLVDWGIGKAINEGTEQSKRSLIRLKIIDAYLSNKLGSGLENGELRRHDVSSFIITLSDCSYALSEGSLQPKS